MIGRRLKEARQRSTRSQGDLGEHLGISQQQVGKYEKGESSLKVWMMLRAAAFLDVSADTFVAAARQPGFAEEPAAYEPDAGTRPALDRIIASLQSMLTELEALRGPEGRPPRRKS